MTPLDHLAVERFGPGGSRRARRRGARDRLVVGLDHEIRGRDRGRPAGTVRSSPTRTTRSATVRRARRRAASLRSSARPRRVVARLAAEFLISTLTSIGRRTRRAPRRGRAARRDARGSATESCEHDEPSRRREPDVEFDPVGAHRVGQANAAGVFSGAARDAPRCPRTSIPSVSPTRGHPAGASHLAALVRHPYAPTFSPAERAAHPNPVTTLPATRRRLTSRSIQRVDPCVQPRSRSSR